MADRVRVAVLGCGPAGLLAAHGVTQAAWVREKDAEVQIYSSKHKSPLFGCQYLHQAIPGLDLPHQKVDYRLTGTLAGYRRKVYGREDVAVSPDLLEASHHAWDIRAAYDQLWARYEPAIEDYFLSPGSWRLLHDKLRHQVDFVISTVPAPVLCKDTEGCTFESETVWAMGDAPELGRGIPDHLRQPPGSIMCNGEGGVPWYRISNVFGYHTAEWPSDAVPPRGASRVSKPLGTTCKCNPCVRRSGRYARWQKGVLAHESFLDAYALAYKALRDE